MQQRIEYPISAGYCANWTMVDAIREVIANAMDEGDFKITYDAYFDGCDIINKGSEIKPKHLVLGNSEKSTDQIGQFGEGLKIAALVAARENRKFYVSTSGFSFRPSIEYSEGLESDILVLTLDETTKNKEETLVHIQCTKEEYADAKAKFLKWSGCKSISKELAPNIFSPGGKLFVNGLYTMPLNSLYSYNLTSTKFINRDRTVVDLSVAKQEIERIIKEEGFPVKEFCKMYLEAAYSNEEVVETGIYLSPNSQSGKEMFTKMAQKMFSDKKLVMNDGTQSDMTMEDKGYTVLPTPVSWAASYTIKTAAGIKESSEELTSNSALTNPDQYVIKDNKLTEYELANMKDARECAEKLDYSSKELVVKVVSKFDNPDRKHDNDIDIIYLHRSLLTEGGSPLFGAMIHECVHIIHGVDDRTHSFEDILTDIIGRLAVLNANAIAE